MVLMPFQFNLVLGLHTNDKTGGLGPADACWLSKGAEACVAMPALGSRWLASA